MHKAVIFDFFGVIYSDPANRWFSEHNIERTGEYADIFKQVDHGFMTLEKAFGELEKLSGQPADDIKSVFGQTDMIDHDVVEIIKKLKQNYTVGLLSNASSGYLRKLLRENSLDILFDDLVISSEVGMIKPNPAIFEIAVNNLGVELNESIFIDDWPGNVSSAEELGIKGLVFTSGKDLQDDLKSLGVKI